MRTLGPSLVALAQASWSLLSNILGGRIASPLVESDKSLVESGVALKKKRNYELFLCYFL